MKLHAQRVMAYFDRWRDESVAGMAKAKLRGDPIGERLHADLILAVDNLRDDLRARGLLDDRTDT